MSFPLEDLPDPVIIEYLERLPDPEFAMMCVQQISKKIRKLCKTRGDFRERMETMKSRKEVKTDGNRIVETYFDKDGNKSNYFGPAVVDIRNGKIYSERFWINGENRALVPEDPILIEYNDNGTVKFQEYNTDDDTIEIHYNKDGSFTEAISGRSGSFLKYYDSDGALIRIVEDIDDDHGIQTVYFKDGGKSVEYLKDNIPGRQDDGPLYIEYDSDGNVVKQLYTAKDIEKYRK